MSRGGRGWGGWKTGREESSGGAAGETGVVKAKEESRYCKEKYEYTVALWKQCMLLGCPTSLLGSPRPKFSALKGNLVFSF